MSSICSHCDVGGLPAGLQLYDAAEGLGVQVSIRCVGLDRLARLLRNVYCSTVYS